MTSLPLDHFTLAATGFDYAMQQPMFPGKLILWILFALSLLSWGVIASRGVGLVRMRRADEEFLKLYRGGRQPLDLYERSYEDSHSMGWILYERGARETAFQMLGSPERDDTFSIRLRSAEAMNAQEMSSVHEALDRGEAAVSARLREGMPLLSLVSVGAPFIGLLGLAWLLMKTFSQAGAGGTVADVSPGVSGALAVMVTGLFAGIPALVAQILLGAAARRRMRDHREFRAELERAIKRAYGSGRDLSLSEAPAIPPAAAASHHVQPLAASRRQRDLDGSGLQSAAEALEASSGALAFSGHSPFVLIEDEEEDPAAARERPIAAFADPEQDFLALDQGYTFRTPFAEAAAPPSPGRIPAMAGA